MKTPGSPKPGEELNEMRPEIEIDVFKNRIDKGEMQNILGLSMSDWEKDPEVAKRMQSLGEVLGLARDLNISVEGLTLSQQNNSQQTSSTDVSNDYLDMPVIGPEFAQNNYDLKPEHASQSLQPNAASTVTRKVSIDAQPDSKSTGIRRTFQQTRRVRGDV